MSSLSPIQEVGHSDTENKPPGVAGSPEAQRAKQAEESKASCSDQASAPSRDASMQLPHRDAETSEGKLRIPPPSSSHEASTGRPVDHQRDSHPSGGDKGTGEGVVRMIAAADTKQQPPSNKSKLSEHLERMIPPRLVVPSSPGAGPSHSGTDAEEGRGKAALGVRPRSVEGDPEDESLSPRSKLRKAAASFGAKPAIYCRPKMIFGETSHESKSHTESETSQNMDEDSTAETAFSVPCWPADPLAKKLQGYSGRHGEDCIYRGKMTESGVRQSVHKVARQKGVSSGRTYTSKYRGVHQTFPTRRWEAQFRRAGKPTSLGCFDREEEAARAYDKMMVWVELHSADMRQTGQMKGGTTNFDLMEYLQDIPDLQLVSQDELVQMLRREGRSQAAANTATALKSRPRISVCAK